MFRVNSDGHFTTNDRKCLLQRATTKTFSNLWFFLSRYFRAWNVCLVYIGGSVYKSVWWNWQKHILYFHCVAFWLLIRTKKIISASASRKYLLHGAICCNLRRTLLWNLNLWKKCPMHVLNTSCRKSPLVFSLNKEKDYYLRATSLVFNYS